MNDKKKKVLIVSSFCFEKASANGICARSLYDSFKHKGVEAHILGIGDGSDFSEYEHTVSDTVRKKTRFKRISAVCRSAKSIFTPPQDTEKIQNYYLKIKQLQKEHNFDFIVAMFFPRELVSAVAKLKKEGQSFSFVIYELDSVVDGIAGNSKSITNKISLQSSAKWSCKCYRLADRICVMKGHEEHVRQMYGKTFGKKITIVDLPLLQDDFLSATDSAGQTIEFVYSGELNTSYRSPLKLLAVLGKSRERTEWIFHFYSKGDCEALLKESEMKDSRIRSHGYVSQDILYRQYDVADFFVSIGNTHSNSVPSKIINYISFGKPIIHFCLQENDICEEYLNRYPLALVIQKNESAEDAVEKIAQFVAHARGRMVEFDALREAFPMNLPSYSVDKILENLN